MRKLAVPLALLGAVVLVATRDAPARACAVVGPPVFVAGEEVFIVWDEAHHMEYFVRHLSFRDANAEFGFVVPTPSRPTLSDVSDSVFASLFNSYRAMYHGGGGENVDVVEEQRVAGLDATVLAATDASGLTGWLGAHHYPATPALTRYLAPYVASGSYVTAFRYTPRANEPRFGTRALCMAFATDRPYFPYAEPDDAPHVRGRVFRITVLANERVAGQLGTTPWTAPTRFAGHPYHLHQIVNGVVPQGAIPPHPWLTTFQEDDSVRGREDLLFTRAASQSLVASHIGARVR